MTGDGTDGSGRNGQTPGTDDESAEGRLSALLTATPSLRADFFANPMQAIGNFLPPPRFWKYGDGPGWLHYLFPLNWYRPFKYRRERRDLAIKIFDKISAQVQDHTLSSAINTDSVFDEFFAPVVRTSQRSYVSIYVLSWITFAVGVFLVLVGAYVGIHPPKNVNSTAIAGIFGGSGVVTALGSVFSMVVTRMRQATSDAARVRVTLTAFATQLGQLRALLESSPTPPTKASVELVTTVNAAIGKAMTNALNGMSAPNASGAAGPTDPKAASKVATS